MKPKRASISTSALAIGLATGAYAISYGVIATSAGLSVAQTCFLSVVMFTGASQFALVGLLLGHGTYLSGALTALLLGSRNAFYGLRLSALLGLKGRWRFFGAQFVIDETTAMTVVQDSVSERRFAFWITAASVFGFWNLGSFLGALGGQALSDPKVFGLDAAAPAAFVALLAPRIRARRAWALVLGGAGVALATVSFVPVGVPVLFAALFAISFGLVSSRRETA